MDEKQDLMPNYWRKLFGASIENVAIFGIALGIIVATKIFWARRKMANLPPGPWGLPFIGELKELCNNIYKCNKNTTKSNKTLISRESIVHVTTYRP